MHCIKPCRHTSNGDERQFFFALPSLVGAMYLLAPEVQLNWNSLEFRKKIRVFNCTLSEGSGEQRQPEVLREIYYERTETVFRFDDKLELLRVLALSSYASPNGIEVHLPNGPHFPQIIICDQSHLGTSHWRTLRSPVSYVTHYGGVVKLIVRPLPISLGKERALDYVKVWIAETRLFGEKKNEGWAFAIPDHICHEIQVELPPERQAEAILLTDAPDWRILVSEESLTTYCTHDDCEGNVVSGMCSVCPHHKQAGQ